MRESSQPGTAAPYLPRHWVRGSLHSVLRKTSWLAGMLGVAAATLGGALSVRSEAAAPPPVITVYKSATCGCCANWVEHVRAAGFKVIVHDTTNLAAIKEHYGVPKHLTSCHTAVVDGYVIEGHVPADVILRLLRERPELAGVAVPGMPAGSPGMDSPTPVRYAIMTFDRAGRTAVFAHR